MIFHIMRSSGKSMINFKQVQKWLEIAGSDDWLGVWWLGVGISSHGSLYGLNFPPV